MLHILNIDNLLFHKIDLIIMYYISVLEGLRDEMNVILKALLFPLDILIFLFYQLDELDVFLKGDDDSFSERLSGAG